MSYGAAHLRKHDDKAAQKRVWHRDVTFSTSSLAWKDVTEPLSNISTTKVLGDTNDASTFLEEMVRKPLTSSSHRGEFRSWGLAEAIHQNHAAIDGGKISLVGCSITNISELTASEARGVHTLYLSNNNIISLNGVTQFRELRNLSLGNNSIRYLGQLKVLGELKNLEKLSLDGNTVVSMPFYRLSVVGLCRHLVQLDGVHVSPEERDLANTVASDIEDYSERLRANELRKVVLEHLAGIMRLHGELQEFLRPLNEESGRVYAHGTMNHRPSDVVRILVEGEVYRWLQISAADVFVCLVQDKARSLHLEIVQSLGTTQRANLLRSPEKLLQHWREVVDGVLQHQKVAIIRLFNECEVCKGGEKRSSQSEVSAENTDLDVLQMLHFREPLGEWELDMNYFGRRSAAVQRQPAMPASPTNMELAASMSQRYKRLLEVQKENTGAKIHASSVSSMTSTLPPQQSEPESPEKGPRPPLPEPVAATEGMRSSAHAQVIKTRNHIKTVIGRNSKEKKRGLDSTLDFSDERVVGFLNRALNANNGRDALQESAVLGRDVVGEWLHANAEAKSLVKLDDNVPIAIRLGPVPAVAEDSPAPARSMPELKDQVQKLSQP